MVYNQLGKKEVEISGVLRKAWVCLFKQRLQKPVLAESARCFNRQYQTALRIMSTLMIEKSMKSFLYINWIFVSVTSTWPNMWNLGLGKLEWNLPHYVSVLDCHWEVFCEKGILEILKIFKEINNSLKSWQTPLKDYEEIAF